VPIPHPISKTFLFLYLLNSANDFMWFSTKNFFLLTSKKNSLDKNIRTYVKNKFDIKISVKKYLELYKNLHDKRIYKTFVKYDKQHR
jgi:hypothetical protein